VTFSTHYDTVPPHVPSGEDEDRIWGRGSCDAKGILAAMVHAAAGLLEADIRGIALLFVVGEEKNSAGARAAARQGRGSQFLINGEPTENKLAVGCKGALRYEISTIGKMAHSAYPELGESAIEKLLDVLQELRQLPLPEDPVLGRSTMNIGTIAGGRAPNVIPDAASAEVMFRLVADAAPLKQAVRRITEGRATAREVLHIPPLRLRGVDGFPSTVVAFTTDIPEFGGAWGEPLLVGPGSILVAHTSEEYVAKQQLSEAVQVYQALAKRLLGHG
jgi:acetylornithine deacetylase